jgi:hypothetical protein
MKPVPRIIPLRLEPYVKLARWISSIVTIPQDSLTPAEVHELHSALHNQKLMGAIIGYEVNRTDVKVGLYQTAEYLQVDIPAGRWMLRTPFEVLAELNGFITGGDS